MQIKDLAIGDGFVYLMEGSTKVKFYVLAHNYESGLNGNGRTLFCRESPATTGPWSSVGEYGRRVDIAWGTTDTGYICSIYNWLTTTYFYKFAAGVKGWMGGNKIFISREYVRYFNLHTFRKRKCVQLIFKTRRSFALR